MAGTGTQARSNRGGIRATRARSRAARTRHLAGGSRARGFVPKVPRLIQQSLDGLIDKAQSDGLTRREQKLLDEALDYLADLTIRELERLRKARR